MISLPLPDVRSAPRWLLAGLVIGAIGIGWLIAHGHANYVAVGAVIATVTVAAFVYPAQLGALLLLVVLNGVPIVNLNGRLPGNLQAQDLAVFGLIALLIVHQDRAPSPERARIIRAATIWSACFIGWWTYEFARSTLLDGIPWLKAALFGRDFLYFAILLPLALRARFPERSLRAAGLLVLFCTAAAGIGQALQSVTGISLGLVHPGIVDTSFGINRLYSSMADIFNTALIFTAALFLSKESRGNRWLLAAFVAVLFVDAAVQLGRANYFALAIALLVGLAVYASRYGSLTAVVVRGGSVVVVLGVVVVAFSAIDGGSNIPAVHTVSSRVTSGVSSLLHSTGTVGYREQVDGNMLSVLGRKWPIGLGFLHPAARYVAGLPSGTIRNSDTGVFNALMTMGIVGVVLIYAPLAYAIRELLRASNNACRAAPRVPGWILCAGVAWIAWGVASSPTLVLFFSVPGLVVTAAVLAALASVIAPPGRVRDASVI